MKVIATNIFDFTTWYKFGSRTVPKTLVIDLDDASLSGEELIRKTGFFEEEYEVFYIEVKEETLINENELLDVSLYDATYIVPVSETGSRLLQNKIPDFKLFAPLDDEVYRKLMIARNNALARQGANRVLAAFNIERKPEYDALEASFLKSLSKYRENLNAEQETILDQVLFYERSKPYPLTDHGFLFDVGNIARTRFGIKDEEIKNKEALKESDFFKYELVEQIINLSRFLTNKDITSAVWSEFIKYYEENNHLHGLNEEMLLSEGLENINNLLAIGLYFKFRDMIRNTRSLEEKPFTDYIQRSLSKAPDETKIALLLNGLFFGGLKFKELHYKFVPLEIARLKIVNPTEPIVTSNNRPLHGSIEDGSPSNKRNIIVDKNAPEQQDTSKLNGDVSVAKYYFDHKLWRRLELFLAKYNTKQREKIKKSFDFVMNFDKSRMFNDEIGFFVNLLKKEAANKRGKEENKLNGEIITEIETEIRNSVPLTDAS